MPEFKHVKHVLLDIEGTICPISFVKDTLFPYAIKALPQVLASKWDDDSFKPYRHAFPEEHSRSPDALQAHVEDLTERDVKVAYLKDLQGYLWEDGYKSGAYSTPLFDDVVPQMHKWTQDGIDLAIYSSGSVFAQKLLFQHVTKVGDGDEIEDLRDVIAGWYDTTNAGSKLETRSYTKIAEAQSWRIDGVLFLSDNVKEVQAAVEAGMKSAILDRPGNAPLSEDDRTTHVVVGTFDALDLRADQAKADADADVKNEQKPNGASVDAVSVTDASPAPKKRKKANETSEPTKAPRRSTRLSST